MIGQTCVCSSTPLPRSTSETARCDSKAAAVVCTARDVHVGQCWNLSGAGRSQQQILDTHRTSWLSLQQWLAPLLIVLQTSSKQGKCHRPTCEVPHTSLDSTLHQAVSRAAIVSHAQVRHRQQMHELTKVSSNRLACQYLVSVFVWHATTGLYVNASQYVRSRTWGCIHCNSPICLASVTAPGH